MQVVLCNGHRTVFNSNRCSSTLNLEAVSRCPDTLLSLVGHRFSFGLEPEVPGINSGLLLLVSSDCDKL